MTGEGLIVIGLLVAWFASAGLMLLVRRSIIRVFIYFGVFSLITSLFFLFLGAPDVAMAEAAISAFTTVFFVVCFERYYSYRRSGGAEVDWAGKPEQMKRTAKDWLRFVPGFVLVVGLFALFINFLPRETLTNTYLKDQYITYFIEDVGGTNAVGAIYLGYRVYDTLFEALMLVISVVAVIHMSAYNHVTEVKKGPPSPIQRWGGMAVFTIRFISPILILFGIYLILNGHLTAGGGFQGGLAVATFFICRYLIYDVYDIPIKKVMKFEEVIFIIAVMIAAMVVFMESVTYLPFVSDYYLIIMNVLIGLKVTCGFIILFYRFIAIERMTGLPEDPEKEGA